MYPKKFFSSCQEPIEKGTVFILMPFAANFESTYKLIKQVLESPEFNLRCYRSDEIYKPEPIIETILRGIAISQFIIADVTNRNPNVFYELGIAHTVKDNCIILTQSMDDVPFDLRHLHCIVYENSLSGAEELKDNLKMAVHTILNEESELTKRKIKKSKIIKVIKNDRNKILNIEEESRKPKLNLDISILDKEFQLEMPFSRKLGIKNYDQPYLKLILNIKIINKDKKYVEIVSTKLEKFYNNQFYSIFYPQEVELYSNNNNSLTYPIGLDTKVDTAIKLFVKFTPLGNSAQLATNLSKIDDSQSIPLNIIMESIDHNGEDNLTNIGGEFNIKPIKELYISDWTQEKQEGLLRLVRINRVQN